VSPLTPFETLAQVRDGCVGEASSFDALQRRLRFGDVEQAVAAVRAFQNAPPERLSSAPSPPPLLSAVDVSALKKAKLEVHPPLRFFEMAQALTAMDKMHEAIVAKIAALKGASLDDSEEGGGYFGALTEADARRGEVVRLDGMARK
jgi:hypothetical protein